MSIRTTRYASLPEFLSAAETSLEKRQWPNSIALSILPSYLTSEPAINLFAEPSLLATIVNDEDPWMGFIMISSHGEDGEIVLCAVQTPSYPRLSLYSVISPSSLSPYQLNSHLTAILEVLGDDVGTLKGFNGEDLLVTPMVDLFLARMGEDRKVATSSPTIIAALLSPDSKTTYLTWALTQSSGHEVRRVSLPLDEQHLENLLQFHAGMFAETSGMVLNPTANRTQILRDISKGWLWAYFVDKIPRASLHLGRETKDGLVVRVVFTERESRGKGYARGLVAEVSKAVVEESRNEGKYLGIFYSEGGVAGRLYEKLGFGDGGEAGKRLGGRWRVRDFGIGRRE